MWGRKRQRLQDKLDGTTVRLLKRMRGLVFNFDQLRENGSGMEITATGLSWHRHWGRWMWVISLKTTDTSLVSDGFKPQTFINRKRMCGVCGRYDDSETYDDF